VEIFYATIRPRKPQPEHDEEKTFMSPTAIRNALEE
jgi:hypothetical protein